MGQAKRRGTFEERRAAAIVRDIELTRKRCAARVYRAGGTGQHHLALLAGVALAVGTPGLFDIKDFYTTRRF